MSEAFVKLLRLATSKLLVAFLNYALSQLYIHCRRNCHFVYFLEAVKTVVLGRNIVQNSGSAGRKPHLIAFLRFYRLVCNIPFYFNDPILV